MLDEVPGDVLDEEPAADVAALPVAVEVEAWRAAATLVALAEVPLPSAATAAPTAISIAAVPAATVRRTRAIRSRADPRAGRRGGD